MAQQSLAGLEPVRTAEYSIVFDGGSRGNPGRGYGSYKIVGPDGEVAHKTLSFDDRGNRVTNNEAEYLTLIEALKQLAQLLGDSAINATVNVRGDSQLVIRQLQGSWRVKKAELQPLHRQAGELLRRFGSYRLIWHDRSNSVRELGH